MGTSASNQTKEKYKKMLRNGELDSQEIEIEVSSKSFTFKSMEIPGMPGGSMGMINLGEIFGKGFGQKKEKENFLLKNLMKFFR